MIDGLSVPGLEIDRLSVTGLQIDGPSVTVMEIDGPSVTETDQQAMQGFGGLRLGTQGVFESLIAKLESNKEEEGSGVR